MTHLFVLKLFYSRTTDNSRIVAPSLHHLAQCYELNMAESASRRVQRSRKHIVTEVAEYVDGIDTNPFAQ